MNLPCPHDNLIPIPCDQTLGVACQDCEAFIGCCWMDDHVSEAIWNKACLNWPDGKPSEQNRDDYCFLCEEQFTPVKK